MTKGIVAHQEVFSAAHFDEILILRDALLMDLPDSTLDEIGWIVVTANRENRLLLGLVKVNTREGCITRACC